jgi:hypothetical protein
MPGDLTDPTARRALVDRVEALGLRVDVLVNNAGVGTNGRFIELDRAGELEQVHLLCEALVDLCGAFVPAMARRRSGAVLIVSSVRPSSGCRTSPPTLRRRPSRSPSASRSTPSCATSGWR